MSGIDSDFDDRLRRMNSRRRVEGGMSRPGGRRLVLPVRAAAVFLALFLMFKGVAIAHLGGVAYEARLATLAQSGLPMRIGVAVLQPDPASILVARKLGPLLR